MIFEDSNGEEMYTISQSESYRLPRLFQLKWIRIFGWEERQHEERRLKYQIMRVP